MNLGSGEDLRPNHPGRAATLILSRVWDNYDKPPCEMEIRRVVFHEVCELLLAKMSLFAESRYITPINLDEVCHEIIRVLDYVLFEVPAVSAPAEPPRH